jgi:hypothetical protein
MILSNFLLVVLLPYWSRMILTARTIRDGMLRWSYGWLLWIAITSHIGSPSSLLLRRSNGSWLAITCFEVQWLVLFIANMRTITSYAQQTNNCGMHLMLSSVFLMLIASCISWSNYMTTKWLITIQLWNRLMRYRYWLRNLSSFHVCCPISLGWWYYR